jgi:hypothetical protein
MLRRLREYDGIDWARASVDAVSVPSQEISPNPADCCKLGTKRHSVVDARGVPLAPTVAGTNRHSMAFERAIDAMPAVLGLSGQPRKRPDRLHADKGYDFARCG